MSSTPRTSLVYDPEVSGYDTTNFWVNITGTPSATGGNMRFNAAQGLYKGQFLRGEYTFNVIVPTSPTSGDDKEWGLKNIASGAYIKFDITDAVFSGQIADGDGNTATVTLTWDTDWAAAETEFKISWEAGTVRFYINNVPVGVKTSDATPNLPLNPYVANADADNLDVGLIVMKDAQSYFAG